MILTENAIINSVKPVDITEKIVYNRNTKNKERNVIPMNDEIKNANELPEEEFGVLTLTDEEDGTESKFELIETYQADDGSIYYALAPVNEDGSEAEEYVILKVEEEEDGGVTLCTIEDDDEYDRIADIFDDMLFSEIDYDAQ